MIRRARALLCAALVLLAGCATNIHDMRLESVRPIAGLHFPYHGTQRDPERRGGVVAEFSSKRDLRRQIARFGDSFFVIVERCTERGRIEDLGWLTAESVGHGILLDDLGLLAEAGYNSLSEIQRLGAVFGVPRNGRYFFQLPIVMMTLSRNPPIVDRRVMRGVVYHDLRRDPEDLCFYVRGFTFFQGVWRSNTVVIPYDAIRAALDPSSPP
jgi:hypothetical protein